jgi:hypothetical protein
MEKSSQIAWKIVPLRHFFPLKVVPFIEVLLYLILQDRSTAKASKPISQGGPERKDGPSLDTRDLLPTTSKKRLQWTVLKSGNLRIQANPSL